MISGGLGAGGTKATPIFFGWNAFVGVCCLCVNDVYDLKLIAVCSEVGSCVKSI